MPFTSACRVSVEKSADRLVGIPLYVICCFPLVAFNILSVFNFCWFDSCVSQCFPTWVYPSWDSLHFLDLIDLISFLMFRKLSAIFSNIFSDPFCLSSLETAILQVLVHWMLSQRSLRLSSFLFILRPPLPNSILRSWFPPFCPPGHLSVLLPQLFCCRFLLVYHLSLFVL